jgi:hypothetical protein
MRERHGNVLARIIYGLNFGEYQIHSYINITKEYMQSMKGK